MLLTNITIRNFKCFRKKTTFDLMNASYFIGANNSGKSTVLMAIRCFFLDEEYSSDYLNRTELISKGKSSNKTIIEITFDIKAITQKTFRRKLSVKYGNSVKITKSFTYREVSRTVSVEYNVNGSIFTRDTLPDNLRILLNGFHVSYIHPQDAEQLLAEALTKLRTRLLNNWGRSSIISETLKTLQESWDGVRIKARKYLSSSLSDSVKNIWPKSSVKIELPESIESILAISDILVKGSGEIIDIPLTSQGAGVQAVVLFQAHYLLDSDKSLHRGFYHPVWLIEEPETFLHADIMMKLGRLLASNEWLNNIQIFTTTHSPMILAASRTNQEKISWILLEDHIPTKSKIVSDWSKAEINEIGKVIGDPNFDAYFNLSSNDDLIFIEDSRVSTVDVFRSSGIKVNAGLNGSLDIKKHLDVLLAVDSIIANNAYFIIDSDKSLSDFKEIISNAKLESEINDFKKYSITEKVFLLTLPSGTSVEDLFSEFNNHLDSCIGQIFKDDLTLKENVPTKFARVVAKIKGRTIPSSLDNAKDLIKNHQEIKDSFWNLVDEEGYKLDPSKTETLKGFLQIDEAASP